MNELAERTMIEGRSHVNSRVGAHLVEAEKKRWGKRMPTMSECTQEPRKTAPAMLASIVSGLLRAAPVAMAATV